MDSKTAYKLQQTARHAFICKMLADIAADMQVCRLEGWDIEEYTKQLNSEIQRILKQFDNV